MTGGYGSLAKRHSTIQFINRPVARRADLGFRCGVGSGPIGMTIEGADTIAELTMRPPAAHRDDRDCHW